MEAGQVASYVWRAGNDPVEPLADAWLDDEEQRAAARLVAPGRRQQYLAAHVLLRWALSQHASAPEQGWRFHRAEHGKPQLSTPTALPMEFSVSHTREAVAVALATTGRIGIDIESLRDNLDYHVIAQQFSPAEQGWLQTLAPAEHAVGIVRLWTLKESYVKARGSTNLLAVLRSTPFATIDLTQHSWLSIVDKDHCSWDIRSGVIGSRTWWAVTASASARATPLPAPREVVLADGALQLVG